MGALAAAVPIVSGIATTVGTVANMRAQRKAEEAAEGRPAPDDYFTAGLNDYLNRLKQYTAPWYIERYRPDIATGYARAHKHDAKERANNAALTATEKESKRDAKASTPYHP